MATNKKEEEKMMTQKWCESCAEGGLETSATGHSTNPDWSGYDLCDDCIAEYNGRAPINFAGTLSPEEV